MNEKWSIGDGKNNAEWCVFKGGVCVASCSTEHGIFISEAQNIATKMNEIDSMRQQLAAANGLIAEQNKLGKERQEWALHTNEVIRSLNQQLSAALAACKLKDESLEAAHNGLRWWMDTFPLHVTEADNEEMLKLVKALTIQPDDDALNAWLGEPVGEVKKHTGSLKDMAIIVWSGEQPAEGTKLYSTRHSDFERHAEDARRMLSTESKEKVE